MRVAGARGGALARGLAGAWIDGSDSTKGRRKPKARESAKHPVWGIELDASHTVDGRNPAPPKKPWDDDSSVNTNKHWFPMV